MRLLILVLSLALAIPAYAGGKLDTSDDIIIKGERDYGLGGPDLAETIIIAPGAPEVHVGPEPRYDYWDFRQDQIDAYYYYAPRRAWRNREIRRYYDRPRYYYRERRYNRGYRRHHRRRY